MRSPLFLQRILDQVVLEHLLGQQLLQSRVLGLQVLEPLGIGHAHAAELAAPQVVGRLTEAMPSAQVLDRHAGLGFAQEADDLLFGKALLHVPSPRGRELDSKLRCYSNLGGRRVGGDDIPGGKGGVVQVAAVVVADGLLFAGDLEIDGVAPETGDADRGADREHALAIFGVVAVADPAAVGAQVAAQKAVVLGDIGGAGQVGDGEQAQGQQGRMQTHRKTPFSTAVAARQ
ncbi:unknown protein [Xanthomonas oryzae pv. oryzae KACC 10331]|uniref:Uncharacterized protein n=1 Tax=Xanthomonas oryzae pv. oryzae (strain KACC10331 / KXO85) TaxID=291331 RepID=Q5H6A7_XANOR|nr:unknown protein [Xanthomonas oryzae pv. oryzae KACC 10331]